MSQDALTGVRWEDLTPEQLELLAAKKRQQQAAVHKEELDGIGEELRGLREREVELKVELNKVTDTIMTLEVRQAQLSGRGGQWRDLGDDSPTQIITEVLYQQPDGATLRASDIRDLALPIMESMGVGGENPTGIINTTLNASKRFIKVGRGLYQLAGWARAQMDILKSVEQMDLEEEAEEEEAEEDQQKPDEPKSKK